MPNRRDIDNALVAKLGSDLQLLTLMPNGVYWQLAPANSKKYVVVSIADGHPQGMFGGRAWESILYLVKAVEFGAGASFNISAATNRIDALLDPQPPDPPATLTIPGYGLMLLQREGVPIHDEEADDKDPTIHWFHGGGYYRIWASADVH